MFMIILLVCLALGMGLGFFFSKNQKLFKINGYLVQLTIALLLFTLGLSIGENQDIINNLANLGFDALLLTIGAVLGSILAVYPVYLIFFKGRE